MQATPENQGQFEAKVAQLTRTQKHVLNLFMQGCDDGVIAESLEIVENTVRQHISRIANKLEIPSDRSDKGFRRRELVKLFRRFAPDQVVSPHYCDEPLRATNSPELVAPKMVTPTVVETEESNQLGRNDQNFVGREEAIAALDGFRERGSKLLQIVAAGGQGKTTLARKYLQSRFSQVIEFAIAKETKDVASVENLLEEKLKQMGEEPGRELMVSLDRLKQKLQSAEIGILIDNLEPALDTTGCFIEEHRSYVELLRVLSDSSLKGFSITTNRESLNEASILLDSYKLRGLNLKSWQQYFRYQSVIVEEQDKSLAEMHNAFGGNPKAMDVVSKAIRQDHDGNLQEYWQKNRDCLLIEPTLKNLVKEQFKRLRELNLNDAYNLLCRLGCYRYQDVPSITEKGLICLLWDMPQSQQQKTITLLLQRGLIECQNKEYYLHPIFKEESTKQLKCDDSSKAHKEIHVFFEKEANTKSSKSHILYAESLWHFNQHIYNLPYENSNHEMIFGFPNQGKQQQNAKKNILGYTKLITQTIKNTSKFLNDPYSLIDFMKAHFYLLQGNSLESIKHFQSVIKNHKTTSSRRLTSHLNLVIIYFLLFDLNLAYKHNQVVFDYLKYSPCDDFEDGDKFFFNAIIHADLFAIKSVIDIDNCLPELSKCEYYLGLGFNQGNWNGIIMQLELLIGYKNLAIQEKNLKIQSLFIPKAFYCIERIKPKLLFNGSKILSSVLLNCEGELLPQQGKLDKAYDCHKESVLSLEKVNIKLFLAESYFQYALTYQKMGDQDNAQTYFNKALYLWSPGQINAPKQIERVKIVMNQ